MVNRITVPLVLLLGIMLMALGIVLSLQKTQHAEASTPRFAEYVSTTTTVSINNFQPENLIQSGAGTLGSIVITGAAAGTMNFYDATTSNINLRTGNTATSTILKASFPASAAAGTYTLDTLVTNGLYVSIVGTMPTSTITYRPN